MVPVVSRTAVAVVGVVGVVSGVAAVKPRAKIIAGSAVSGRTGLRNPLVRKQQCRTEHRGESKTNPMLFHDRVSKTSDKKGVLGQVED